MMNRWSRRQLLLAAGAFALVGACQAKPQNQSLPSPLSKVSPEQLRVVALEWVYAENLLALGIQPVGVADIRGYRQFVNVQPALDQSVTDVGTRQEPNLETIARLKPDLILGVQFRHAPVYQSLQAIAPTQLFNPYPQSGQMTQFAEMQATFRAIATAVDRQAQGDAVLQQLQQDLVQGAAKLKTTGLAEQPFVLAQFVAGMPQIRLFTTNALAVQTLQALGLQNAWNKQTDPFGFNTVWLEELSTLPTVRCLYIAAESDPVFRQLQNNPVWQGLEFVKQNRFHALGSNTWLFGGPLSTRQLIDKTILALTQA